MTTWDEHVAAWSAPPIDDVGYEPAVELLGLSGAELAEMAMRMRHARYSGWRNAGGRWRAALGLDELIGCAVLDWGCGFGMESAEWARHNAVWLADITAANLALAARVCEALHHPTRGGWVIAEGPPFINTDERFDVIACSGVLHHSRTPGAVLARWAELLRPGGQVRLLVYSELMWLAATGGPPTDIEDPSLDHRFGTYVRFCDSVGDYADWYDLPRLRRRIGDTPFMIEHVGYVGGDRFLGATLRRL